MAGLPFFFCHLGLLREANGLGDWENSYEPWCKPNRPRYGGAVAPPIILPWILHDC